MLVEGEPVCPNGLESEKPPRAPRSHDQRELEYQFTTASLGAAEQWIREQHPRFGFDLEAAGSRKLEDTYLDTPDWRIFRAGYKLRLRRTGGRCEVTFKSLTSPRARSLKDRREVTQVVCRPDLGSLRTARGTVADWLRSLLGKTRPDPLFRLSTLRTVYFLKRRGERIAEIDLDECQIAAGKEGTGPHAKLHFVELESPDARTREVQRFIRVMARECALRPSRQSKFGEGLSASRLKPVASPPLPPAMVPVGAAIGTFAHSIFRYELAEILGHEAGARMGVEAEELHQMRVAIRRLRAALQLLSDFLPRSLLRCEDSLKWLASVLGAVRDLDVKLAQVHAWRDESGPGDQLGFDAIIERVARQRAHARHGMLKALESRRYAGLIRRLEEHLNRGPACAGSAKAASLEILPQLIRPVHRAVLKAGRRLRGEPTPEGYHRLRVRCKRLRYSLEFAARLGGRSLKGPRKRLIALQDLLGELNDTVVARANIRMWIEETGALLPPPVPFLLGKLEERLRNRGEACLRTFPKCFRAFNKKPWRALEKTLRQA